MPIKRNCLATRASEAVHLAIHSTLQAVLYPRADPDSAELINGSTSRFDGGQSRNTASLEVSIRRASELKVVCAFYDRAYENR